MTPPCEGGIFHAVSAASSSDLRVSEIALGSWLTYGGGASRGHRRWLAYARPSRPASTSSIRPMSTDGVRLKPCWAMHWRAFRARPSYSRPRCSSRCPLRIRAPSRAQIVGQLDRFLQRLRTDYVDLYQCHRYDPGTPLEETMRALTDVVRQGKVRYIGFSEWPVDKRPRCDRNPRCGAVRLEPAAVLPALADAGAGGHPFAAGTPSPRSWVAARARGAERQIPPRSGVAAGDARHQFEHGDIPASELAVRADATGGPGGCGPGEAEPPHTGAVRPGLGAARTQCSGGHRRRHPARAGGAKTLRHRARWWILRISLKPSAFSLFRLDAGCGLFRRGIHVMPRPGFSHRGRRVLIVVQ